MKFENSVVIVTGGASGLGLAFVHLAVKNKVVILDLILRLKLLFLTLMRKKENNCNKN
jgi:NAD(P)-dependent dehydrogenase (short-subunit alcohol dehydrogenase family)